MDRSQVTRVAIACQGGGSHTAFTAGVLKGILTALSRGKPDSLAIRKEISLISRIFCPFSGI